jgi:arginase
MPFDLALAYPQWQGSGRHENLPRGAAAAAAVCAQFAPVSEVPLSASEMNGDGVRCWGAIFDQFRSAQDILSSSGADRVLTAGGDCAVDIAVIDYLTGRHPNLNVIWVDAHLDANTPETSPSGSFHGMPVAAILGRAPEAMRPFLKSPLDPTRLHYFGVQVGDDGDWALQRELGLGTFAPDARLDGPVHIHFDLDVLDPAEFPYLAYTDGKLGVEEAVALVRSIAQSHDLVGLTLTEFSPADEVAARRGSGVIARLCEAATSKRHKS